MTKAAPPTTTVHIVGLDVLVGSHLRQLCAWCGTELVDMDLGYVAVPEGQDPRPGTWPVGGLVEMTDDGSATWVVEHVDGDDLPPRACAAPPSPETLGGG